MKVCNKKDGFTLIEILIAISILAIGIVGALQAFPLGGHIAKSGQMSSIATWLGQEKIEEIASKTYNEILVGAATESYGTISYFPSFKRMVTISCLNPDLEEVVCNYDFEKDPNPIKKIEIAVFWKSPLSTSESNIKLATLFSKK